MTLTEEKINMRYTVFGVRGFNLQGFERAVKIFVVLIGLVIIFKTKITEVVNSIFEKIVSQSSSVQETKRPGDCMAGIDISGIFKFVSHLSGVGAEAVCKENGGTGGREQSVFSLFRI